MSTGDAIDGGISAVTQRVYCIVIGSIFKIAHPAVSLWYCSERKRREATYN